MAENNHTNTSEIPLSCGHELVYRKPYPKIGEHIYCRRCDNYTAVIRKAPRPHHKLNITTIDRI